MKLSAIQVLEDGDNGRVQVTLGNDGGDQTTYQFSGKVSVKFSSHSNGLMVASVCVDMLKPDTIAGNLPKSRFNN